MIFKNLTFIKSYKNLICCLLLCFVSPENGQSAEWIKLGENELGVFLYDTSSISTDENGMLRVKQKQIYTRNTSKALGDAMSDIKGVSFSISHDRIDCNKKVYELERIIYFDKKGKILHDSESAKGNYRAIGFRPIPPGTPIGRITTMVCK
jgi:hypothetical protein